jgi:hypothetical protein
VIEIALPFFSRSCRALAKLASEILQLRVRSGESKIVGSPLGN